MQTACEVPMQEHLRITFALHACNGISLLPSFKKRLLLRTEKTTERSNRNTSRIRNDCLTPMEMKQKLEEQKQRLDFKDLQLFFEKSKNLMLRI